MQGSCFSSLLSYLRYGCRNGDSFLHPNLRRDGRATAALDPWLCICTGTQKAGRHLREQRALVWPWWLSVESCWWKSMK